MGFPAGVIMGGRGGGPSTGSRAPTASTGKLFSDDASLPLATRVAVALEEIRVREGADRTDFQRIDQVHDKLSDVSADVLTRTIREMASRDRSIVLNPQSNQKILTDRQRRLAVTLGNEQKHLIKLMPRGRDALLSPGRAAS